MLFDDDSAYSFGAFLGERYPFHPFILGGDSNRYWNTGTMEHIKAGKNSRDLEVVDSGHLTEAMAKGLADGEAKAKVALQLGEDYTTFITYHSAQGEWVGRSQKPRGLRFSMAPWDGRGDLVRSVSRRQVAVTRCGSDRPLR